MSIVVKFTDADFSANSLPYTFGKILTERWMDANGKIAYFANRYLQYIEVVPGDTVYMSLISGAPGSYYAFVTSIDTGTHLVTGGARISVAEGTEATATAPEDAKYIVFSGLSMGVDYSLSEIQVNGKNVVFPPYPSA